MDTRRYLKLAALVAARHRRDHRSYALGAVAVRRDGAVVASRNEAAQSRQPAAHAEVRALRKAGAGATLFVVRVKRDGSLGLASPCRGCVLVMRAHRVRRCYFSINDRTVGILLMRGSQ